MSNADIIAALYDHEREQPRDGDRRRRDAEDWGADDLFDGTPQRTNRFARGGHPGAPRRVVADWFADDDDHRDAARLADADDDRAFDRRDAFDDRAFDPRDAFEDRAFDPRVAFDDRADDDRDDDPRRAPGVSTTAPTLELDLPIGATRPRRRTVTVTGHPEATRRAERAVELHHRRPGRSLDDRIAHRPDHIAAYACGLGFLLILIAVLTASP